MSSLIADTIASDLVGMKWRARLSANANTKDRRETGRPRRSMAVALLRPFVNATTSGEDECSITTRDVKFVQLETGSGPLFTDLDDAASVLCDQRE